MGKSVTDIIEQYLKNKIEESERGKAEIKRSEIAEKFQCVPSQINYVINTRFTVERGYSVESKRGGGGYIRIYRIEMHSKLDVLQHALEELEESASSTVAEDLIRLLHEEQVINDREARLMLAATARSTILQPLPERDYLRARILEAMIRTLLYEKQY